MYEGNVRARGTEPWTTPNTNCIVISKRRMGNKTKKTHFNDDFGGLAVHTVGLDEDNCCSIRGGIKFGKWIFKMVLKDSDALVLLWYREFPRLRLGNQCPFVAHFYYITIESCRTVYRIQNTNRWRWSECLTAWNATWPDISNACQVSCRRRSPWSRFQLTQIRDVEGPERDLDFVTS